MSAVSVAGRRRWPAFLGGLGVGVLGVALGGSALLADRIATSPIADQSLPTPVVVPVVTQQRTLSRPVTLKVMEGSPAVVLVHHPGTLTSLKASPGSDIKNGSEVARVDGVPIFAMMTDSPMHRDLAAGMSGDDVAQAQRWLSALGHTVPITGRFDAPTRQAIQRWQASVGVPKSGQLPQSLVAWVNPAASRVTSVDIPVGSGVNTGDKLLTLAAVPAAILVSEPAGIAAGTPMTLRLGDLSVDYVAGTGRVTDPAGAASVARALGTSGEGAGRLESRQATTVLSVPASSVVTDASGVTCVFANATDPPVKVNPVGGGIGGVDLPGDTPVSTVLVNPVQTRTRPGCS